MRRGFRAMVRALRRACAYPHPAGHVLCIETHLSVVYLAGRYAYKLKKPVRFGFIDLSTREARWRSCHDEFTLNRQFARSLYLGVVPVARHARSFAFGARGEIAEYAVKMRRFDEGGIFSALAARGELSADDIDRLAQRLADLHAHAPRTAPTHLGGAASIAEQVSAARDSLEREAPGLVPRTLQDFFTGELTRLAAHCEARREAGFVRGCHGDLHLANIVRRGCDVLLFDCIEFSDALRWIDVVNDLAFPVMDLLAHGQAQLAARLLNRWVTATGDFAGLAALRLFVAYRALVRALVAVLKARGSNRSAEGLANAACYVGVAERAAAPPRPFLLLCHGLSGCGKSVASEALAPLIGAIRVSSDIERKRHAPFSATGSFPLPPTAYTTEAIDMHYGQLLNTTDALLRNGYPVVVDASFLKHTNRSRFIELARAYAIPVAILDFQAAPVLLERRVCARSARGGSASDADLSVVKLQRETAEPLTGAESALAVALNTDTELARFQDRDYWQLLAQRLPALGWLT